MNAATSHSYRQLLARTDMRALLLATCLSRLAGRMFMLAIVLYALAQTNSLLLLTAIFSLTSPLSAVGIRALLPRFAPIGALDRANALDTATHGVTDVFGPVLAGTLVGFGGPDAALCAVALIYAVAAWSVRGLRGGRKSVPSVPLLLLNAKLGLVRVVMQPTLRGLAVSYVLYQIAWAS